MTETECRGKMVCMAMDAFRICIGMNPRNFTRREVVRYISVMALGEKKP